jgi:OOP family OmpA-OmpF porin
MFDCWVEEQEENHRPKDIARGRNGYYNAVTEMEVALRPPPEPEPVAKVEPEPEPVVAAEPEPNPVPKYFIVYFDLNNSVLSEQARWEIRQAVSAAKNARRATIAVYGHADRAGRITYNDRLAERRARKVLNAIKEAGGIGVPVIMESYGELKPAVMTSDGVANGRNRRVEILIKE